MYTIYKLTNDVNGLIYVGCTTKTVKERMKGHRSAYKRKNNSLYEAMREFGFDNFSTSILERGDVDSIRYEREKYWIAKLNSMDVSIGYNQTVGGLGTIGYTFTEKDKKKISEAGIGRKWTEESKEKLRQKNLGKKMSEEAKKNLSIARLGRFTGKDNPFYGRHHTQETKDKAKKTKIKLNMCRAVEGMNLKTKEIVNFDTIADAGRFVLEFHECKLHTAMSHIANSIKEINCKTAYGYKWRYVDKLNDYPDKE